MHIKMKGRFNLVIIFGVVVFFERCSTEISSSLVTKTSLTTAKVRDGNLIPKPTSYLRRISVEPVQQSSSTPYGLGDRGPHRRAARLTKDALHDVWDWDYWCQLQLMRGNCSNIAPRYYYEAQMDTCKPFIYSGCDHNKNNFITLADCEGDCKGTSKIILKETNSSIYCDLQPNVGMCLALLERYYYDVTTNECKTFIYGGCGGNQNRFDNIGRCETRCKKGNSNRK